MTAEGHGTTSQGMGDTWPTYIVPTDAIPNGGYVVVNGQRLWVMSEQQARAHAEHWKAELEKFRESQRPGGWLRRLFGIAR